MHVVKRVMLTFIAFIFAMRFASWPCSFENTYFDLFQCEVYVSAMGKLGKVSSIQLISASPLDAEEKAACFVLEPFIMNDN
jgi:hypothetical protein